MKKLFLLLALATGVAHAEDPACSWWGITAKNTQIVLNPTEVTQWMQADSDKASFVISWYCDVKYRWQSVSIYGWKKDLQPDWLNIYLGLPTLSNAAALALYKSTVTCDYGDITSLGCEKYAELVPIAVRALRASVPPAIVWLVRDNPTSTTRPVYPVTNNVRSNLATTEKVSDTAQCDCAKLALDEAGGTYCSVSGLVNQTNVSTKIVDNRVALCVRKY